MQQAQGEASAELRSLQVQLARAQLAQIQQAGDGDRGPIVVAQARSGQGSGIIWIDLLNVGAGEARNVRLAEMKQLNGGREEIFLGGEVERKLPADRLRPGERVSLEATLTMGTATEFLACVEWEDDSGQVTREDYRLDLLAI